MDTNRSAFATWWQSILIDLKYGWRRWPKPKKNMALNPTHEAADAFWKYWRENGETHKHGYYESTWGAINAALATSGVVNKKSPPPE